MKTYTSIVGAVGLLTGYFIHGLIDTVSKGASDTQLTDANSESPIPVKVYETTTSLISPVNRDVARLLPEDETLALDDETQGPLSEETLATGDFFAMLDDSAQSLSVFIYRTTIDQLGSGEHNHIIQEFNEWMNANGNPAGPVVELLLSDIDIEQRHALEYLIAAGSAQGELPGFTENLIAELATANPDDADEWVEMLALVNVDTPEARQDLLTIIPMMSDQSMASASINSLSPSIVPPEERSQIVSQLSVYVDSEHPQVKAAATTALGSWGATDYTYLIEGALTSQHPQDQSAALHAVAAGGLWNGNIQNSVVSILENESADMGVRYAAFSTLMGHALEGRDYNSFYAFYNSHIVPTEQ